MIDIEKYKDFVQSETPDRKLIADIIQEIRGSRSAATYAADIGLNPTRISRIVNENYANALDTDTLVKLADGDEKFFERLLAANGMISPKEQERKSLQNNMRSNMDAYRDREKKCGSIIVSELLSRGIGLRQAEGRLKDERNNKILRMDYEFEVTDKKGKCTDWYFEICVHEIGSPKWIMGMHNDPAKLASLFFNNRLPIFLTDAWKPETLLKCKVSFVFCDESIMNEFEKLVVKEKLNNKFSLILVDLDAAKVVKEVILNSEDDLHVFDWDVINAKKKDSFVGEFDEEYMGV